MKIFIRIFLILSFYQVALANEAAFEPDSTWVKKELKKMRLSKDFIKFSMQNYDDESFEKIANLNIMMGIFHSTSHPHQHVDRVTDEAVNESLAFMQEHDKCFSEATKRYHVPASVISSLLWIETRHGDDTGTFHTLSVFLNLLQMDRKQNRQHFIEQAMKQNKNDHQFKEKELRHLLAERTSRKSEWARQEILALAKIHDDKKLDLKALHGSYAGAFGLPQFIPSSYLTFAKANKIKKSPDLNKPNDAIMSVAYYLTKHGWKNKTADKKVAALMKYNNSRDYADSILQIAKRVSDQSSQARSISSN